MAADNILTPSCPRPLLQVLSLPVHQLLTHESEEHGGPAGQLRGHPDELFGLCRHQAAAHQGHTEEAVQGDHDGTGNRATHTGYLKILLIFRKKKKKVLMTGTV